MRALSKKGRGKPLFKEVTDSLPHVNIRIASTCVSTPSYLAFSVVITGPSTIAIQSGRYSFRRRSFWRPRYLDKAPEKIPEQASSLSHSECAKKIAPLHKCEGSRCGSQLSHVLKIDSRTSVIPPLLNSVFT